MSITTLFSNVPNFVKALSLSAAVGTGGAMAMQSAPSPMDTTPMVSASADEGERGPSHATGLERARSKANAHAADGLSRAEAAKARAAERRAERGERGERRARGHERGERGHDHAERAERGPRGERAERGPRGERAERGPRGERAERGPRGERGGRPF